MALFRRLPANSFLARLRRDKGGNVLAITAAAIIPMIGVVGGAIDASRLYMVRSRLQAACDSAVLAGRKAMVNANYDNLIARPRAEAMFAFNYKDADYQTSGPGFSASAENTGRLNGTATKSVPMTLMKMFGFGSVSQTVTCSADIQIPNLDVVFVLDVTGSMNTILPDGDSNPWNDRTRLEVLQEAARNFYTTLQTQLASQGANAGQVRYGFVPYSQTVNVSELFANTPNPDLGQLDRSHLRGSVTIPSRVAHFSAGSGDWVYEPGADITYTQTWDANDIETTRPDLVAPYSNNNTNTNDSTTKMSTYDCDMYGTNKSFSIDSGVYREVTMYPRTSYPGQGNGDSTLYWIPGNNFASASNAEATTEVWKITFRRLSNDWNDNNNSANYQRCQREVKMQKFTRGTFQFDHWSYQPVTYDVSDYLAGGSITMMTSFRSGYVAPSAGPFDPVQLAATANASRLNRRTVTWNGCIEERDTVATTSFSPIPADAHDLNVLTGGTSDATRWRPMLQWLTYDTTRVDGNLANTTDTISSSNTDCPPQSIWNLRTLTQTQFNNYINGLSAVGNTYLDVGMMWGLRLISPQGMFGARNLTGPNGGQISRHIIFLTDGALVTIDGEVAAYGVERVSRRITGTTGQSSSSLHAARFQALCNTQRGTVNIWAVALATSVASNLSACADPGRAFQADNAAQLNAAFQNIARTISDLRLVQ